MSSKQEIRKIPGVLNVCRGVCPNLQAWVARLQAMLKKKDFLNVESLEAIVSRVWSYVLQYNTNLSLTMELAEFHVMVD